MKLRLITTSAAAALVLGVVATAPAQLGSRPPVVRPPVYGVPEIDPGLLRSALALLAGGLLVLGDRRRRPS